MRIVFVGAGKVSIETAKELIKNGHKIIIIESSKSRIEELSTENLDCNFILGDGSYPEILRETNPENTDILFCLTKNDQINILSSLVGKSLGFKLVIPSVSDTTFESVCSALGLKNAIFPVKTISHFLQKLVSEQKTQQDAIQ
jgi:trk system potassium uptake protein TrkA